MFADIALVPAGMMTLKNEAVYDVSASPHSVVSNFECLSMHPPLAFTPSLVCFVQEASTEVLYLHTCKGKNGFCSFAWLDGASVMLVD